MSQLGHLQPSCSDVADGGLSSDRFRARRMLVTEEMGQFQTKPMECGAAKQSLGRVNVVQRNSSQSKPSVPLSRADPGGSYLGAGGMAEE